MSEKLKDNSQGRNVVQDLRSQIDSLDSRLLQLLADRRGLIRQIAEQKASDGSPLRDPKREQEILVEQIKRGRDVGLDSHYVTRLFHEIIDDSVRLQQELFQGRANNAQSKADLVRVAFHGIQGSYSYLAARKHFSRLGDTAAFLGRGTFEEVVKAIENGQADYAILPIENTTSGGIHEVYDLLLHSQVAIVGEEKYRINHCLIAADATALGDITKIYCRPSSVTECSKFLSQLPQVQVEYLTDSALSLQRIREQKIPGLAAIASPEAAELFGMQVVARDISNQAENFNRYLIAARMPIAVDRRIPCKTSLVMATAQKPGALVEALLAFRDRNISLTKLDSRPIQGNPWEEMFYVDFEGNIQDEHVAEALAEVTRSARFIKVLGSYPSYDLVRTQVPSETGDEAAARASAQAASAAASKAADAIANTSPELKAPADKTAAKKKPIYKLASREQKEEDTIIEIGGVKIGGDNFVVIAGPCSVESYDQIMTCAREAKENGVHILRGGCFKPRTSPYSFQGLGLQGLDFLVEAGKRFGMPVITEVMSEEDIGPIAEKSDILQIGARNMQNFSLLKAIGRTQRPIMLKRGLSSSIEELLQAVEYILSQGNQQVFLCERGIRTFETATRNTLDLSAVPVLKRKTHLPIFVDPSHAAGERDLVPPLALAAKAVGSHGIMVEFHPEPEKALSDGPQALRFPQFAKMMSDLRGI